MIIYNIMIIYCLRPRQEIISCRKNELITMACDRLWSNKINTPLFEDNWWHWHRMKLCWCRAKGSLPLLALVTCTYLYYQDKKMHHLVDIHRFSQSKFSLTIKFMCSLTVIRAYQFLLVQTRIMANSQLYNSQPLCSHFLEDCNVTASSYFFLARHVPTYR